MTIPLAAAATQDPLIPTWPELIIGIIVFAVVFGVLGKMLLPRILKTLNEREDAIQGGINRADEAQAEAAAVLAQYRAQLDDARHEASRLREEAREQGAQIIVEMRERAEVGTLATDLASRIVGESLTDQARQSRMVDRFLEDLEAQQSNRVGGSGAPQ